MRCILMMSSSDPKIINIEDIETKPTKWIWHPFIPSGAITILQGDPGEGKSTLMTQIIARLSRGEAIFDEPQPHEPINIIYQNSEDSLSRTIRPRLEKANADLSKVSFIDESDYCLSMSDSLIEKTIIQKEPKLFVLDPMQAYLGSKIDFHRANEIRPVMHHLSALAERYECAIVLVGHLNKMSGNKAAYRGLGSIDIFGAARSVLVVGTPQNNPDVRVLAHSKSNLSEKGSSIEFQLNPFKFLGRTNISADELLGSSPSITKSKLAENLILEMLSDGVAKPKKEFIKRAAENDISPRTLDDAKNRLKVESNKYGKFWFWEPPEQQCNKT